MHKLARILPTGLYDLLLAVRLRTFRKQCDNPHASRPVYTDGSWVARKTTKDQRAIEAWLTAEPLANKQVLHVGIGNSSLAAQVAPHVAILDGVTIIQEEIDHADSLSLPHYTTFLINKYGRGLEALPHNYDYIIDNDLAGYACCMYHFEQMMRHYRALLRPSGVIATGAHGLRYFDTGFAMTEPFLHALADRHNLAIERHPEFVLLCAA
jgi:hypothetical protein